MRRMRDSYKCRLIQRLCRLTQSASATLPAERYYAIWASLSIPDRRLPLLVAAALGMVNCLLILLWLFLCGVRFLWQFTDCVDSYVNMRQYARIYSVQAVCIVFVLAHVPWWQLLVCVRDIYIILFTPSLFLDDYLRRFSFPHQGLFWRWCTVLIHVFYLLTLVRVYREFLSASVRLYCW